MRTHYWVAPADPRYAPSRAAAANINKRLIDSGNAHNRAAFEHAIAECSDDMRGMLCVIPEGR